MPLAEHVQVGKKLRKEIAGITDLDERRTLREHLENWLKSAQPERTRTKRGGTGIGLANELEAAEEVAGEWIRAVTNDVIP